MSVESMTLVQAIALYQLEATVNARIDEAIAGLLAPATQLGTVHAEVESVAHPHHEAGNVAAQGNAASGAATREGARLEDGIAGAAGHGEDEHGGRVA